MQGAVVRFGIVGLGRMGLSLATKAVEGGHQVVGWDPYSDPEHARQAGVSPVGSLEELAQQLEPPRFVMLYVPHGEPVDATLDGLLPHLASGDIVADAGNSHWEHSRRRHQAAAQTGVRFLDLGTSGGTSQAVGWRGAAFMAGGDRDAFEHIRPLLEHLAVDAQAVFYAGQSGAGHFAKLVHNAIEFGMIQAIAEGVELLHRSGFEVDVPGLFDHWNHGTVIRSWLVQLMGNALRGQELTELATYTEDTGEVKWVLEWALERDIPTPVVAASQQMLMAYRDLDWPAAKAVALLRNQFGAHPVHRRDDQPTRT